MHSQTNSTTTRRRLRHFGLTTVLRRRDAELLTPRASRAHAAPVRIRRVPRWALLPPDNARGPAHPAAVVRAKLKVRQAARRNRAPFSRSALLRAPRAMRGQTRA